MNAWATGLLPGVLRRRIVVHQDPRGSFSELWRASWTDGLPIGRPSERMVQVNLSRSETGVLRGLHVHRRQADLWIVAEGTPFIALADLRPAIRDSGPVAVETILAGPGDAVYLPPGIAHGFYAPAPITLVYLVSNEYDGSDELGFAWNDPAAAIPWPDADPMVSPRDATAPSLSTLLAELRLDDQSFVESN
jgi:dTDP-4-dehydrorhamnose 3,5-epimerase